MKAGHLVGIVGVGIAGVIALRLAMGTDFLYSRDVEGRVVAKDSRLATTEGKTFEKIALRLNPYEADQQVVGDAGGVEGLDVECISTRCSLLAQGDCIMLACKRNVRFFEPNVIECKAIKTVECKK